MTGTARGSRLGVQRGTSVGRLVLLVSGGVGLLGGLWTGLRRVGLPFPGGPDLAHGVLMTLGFLGTLIALERAVAYRARWSYLAPALAGLAALWVLAGGPQRGAGLLFTVAGVLVCIVAGLTWWRHREVYLAFMAVGGVAWVIAAAAWAQGVSPARLAPSLAAFLVLTIIGERLELSRLRQPSRAATRRLLAIIVVFILGVIVGWFAPASGLIVAGVGLVAITGWFVRHDLARVTVHRPGLPRFAAVCMLAGYGWLAAGGALWVVLGIGAGGPLLYDAAMHAIFLGFVISMVMGHAPIILPAVLRVPLPYRRVAWFPLGLLHLTLLGRVVADVFDATSGRQIAAAGNVVAVLAFVVISIGVVLHARCAAPRAGLAANLER